MNMVKRFEYIDQTDLSFLASRVSKRHGIELAQCLAAVHEFKKFVKLVIAMPHQSHGMSGLVDEIWHEFIIFTERYRDFCRNAIGWFLDHHPNDGDTTTSDSQATIDKIVALFGTTDRFVWSGESCRSKPNNDLTSDCAGGGGACDAGVAPIISVKVDCAGTAGCTAERSIDCASGTISDDDKKANLELQWDGCGDPFK